MNEFLLVFRRDYITTKDQLSALEMETHAKRWDDWLGILAAQNILARPFRNIDAQGIVLNPNNSVSAGPFYELRESIAGFIVINALNYDDALKIAQGCPILEVGGNIEVRLGN